MDDLLTPEEIELAVKAAGHSIVDMCALAGVSQSIFSRWRSGETEPNLGNYRRIVASARALAPGLRGPTPKQRWRQFRRVVEDGGAA